MNDYTRTQSNYDRGYASSSYSSNTGALTFSGVMTRVYVWMTAALMLTAGAAFLTVASPAILNLIFGNPVMVWVLFGGELALVMAISWGINRLSPTMATALFLLYSVINGVTMSSIFFAYSIGTIAQAFAASALTFGAMSIVGWTTKKDLSGIGRIVIMALIGLIIASVVNIFLGSSMLDAVITYAGVFLFVGITAWDTQKIKTMSEAAEVYGDKDATRRVAILGALSLYLDFINLFLYILRLLGRNRN